ncbi:hypothetical protein PVAND_010789 [Polypedilum vanderplanki]|uniref:Uncharacterized protein n=1 Tax=Polypedilum vanderplanki TaxID=319348 RepID=A0A9J6CGN1_POLVA|nr:hypothetical protein PVAND_010789 [Polypedilum vanderplanki]
MFFQNFNNLILSEQKLELIENKQRKILQKLRKEYKSLRKNANRKLTSNEKFERLKTVHSLYKFKIPFISNNEQNSKKSVNYLRRKSELDLTLATKFHKLKKIRDSYTFKLPPNINKALNEQRPKTFPPAVKIINRRLPVTQRMRSAEINRKSIAKNIVSTERARSSPSVELHKRKILYKRYTFKLPTENAINYESGDNEVHEKFYNKSLSSREIRRKTIAAGNLFSKNNQNTPILKKFNFKTLEAMKHERIKKARALGNSFSMNFKQTHIFDVKNDKKNINLHLERKSFKELVTRKEKLELKQRNSLKFNRSLPMNFIDQYFEVMEQLFAYEDTFGFKINELENSWEIIQFNRLEPDQNLINALQNSNIFESEVKANSRQIFHGAGAVDIEKILKAAQLVRESVDKATIHDEKLILENDSVMETSAKYYDLDKSLSDSKFEENENLNIFKCIQEIIDSCLQNISILFNSFTSIESTNDLITNAGRIMTSNESIEENADNRQKLLSSHEICKCNGIESSTSSMFETASEGDVSSANNNITGKLQRCNESDNDDNDCVNECTNEYSDKMKTPTIEVLRRIIKFD